MTEAAPTDPAPLPDASAARGLRRALLAWYDREARDLPWRRTRDPYAIWISEAMLQQTRVETVVDRWASFLKRFPDIATLAASSEDEVVAEWSGLGYYRRARNLRVAAQAMVREHAGRFPAARAAAEALPGVGRYTAGAVLSIAYEAPEALVDGNVERVFARWFRVRERAASPALKAACWRFAEALVPVRRPGDWNQALMELGATICTPRAPRCLLCPVRSSCAARAVGEEAGLPLPKPKVQPIPVTLALAVVQRRGRWLLEQRPPGGLMGGMWQLPTVERGTSTGLFPDAWPGEAELTLGEPLFQLSHGITRYRIQATVHGAQLKGRIRAPLAWYDDPLAGPALTGMARKALKRLR